MYLILLCGWKWTIFPKFWKCWIQKYFRWVGSKSGQPKAVPPSLARCHKFLQIYHSEAVINHLPYVRTWQYHALFYSGPAAPGILIYNIKVGHHHHRHGYIVMGQTQGGVNELKPLRKLALVKVLYRKFAFNIGQSFFTFFSP